MNAKGNVSHGPLFPELVAHPLHIEAELILKDLRVTFALLLGPTDPLLCIYIVTPLERDARPSVVTAYDGRSDDRTRWIVTIVLKHMDAIASR